MTRRRDWVRVSNHILDDPDLDGMKQDAKQSIAGAFVAVIGYCSRERTDGRISAKKLRENASLRARRELLRLGWVAEDGDGYLVPNYLQWQQSAAEAEAASVAGRRAVGERWSRDTKRNTGRNTERKPEPIRNVDTDRDRDIRVDVVTPGTGRAGARGDADPDDPPRDYRRGPARPVEPTRVYAPGHGPGRDMRPTPVPPPWAAPRSNPAPEVAEDGARLARRLLAEREPAPNRSPARNEAEASLDTETEPDDPGSEQPPF